MRAKVRAESERGGEQKKGEEREAEERSAEWRGAAEESAGKGAFCSNFSFTRKSSAEVSLFYIQDYKTYV